MAERKSAKQLQIDEVEQNGKKMKEKKHQLRLLNQLKKLMEKVL